MRISNAIVAALGALIVAPAGAECNAPEIAYLRFTDGYWQVWLTDANGDCHQQLTRDPLDKTRLSWSPGKRVIMANDNSGGLFELSVSGDRKPLILPLVGMLDAVVSNDGDRVSFSLNSAQSWDNNDIWTLNLQDNIQRKVSNMPGVEQSPAWSKDGTHIVFAAKGKAATYQLWEVDLASGTNTQITVDEAMHFDPVYTSAGDVTFASDRAGNYDIWVWRRADNQFQQITNDPSYEAQPAWSSDGKRLAIYSLRDNQKRVWVRDSSDMKMKPITPATVASRAPVWLR